MPEDERTAFYLELAARAAEHAVECLRGDPGEEAGPALSLAEVAERAAQGQATQEEVADMDEYELIDDDDYGIRDVRKCICSPELVARGGFKGGCPVHA